jgi:MFS family permease
MKGGGNNAGVAWLLAAVFYFYQYVLRTAPSVMLPQLSAGFALDTLGLASLIGVFYYAYSPFSLVAGSALDRLGAKAAIPAGALITAVGALLFGSGDASVAGIGRFLQGAGGVFALVGAVYIATSGFPASRAATLIGATQMFGMSGGSAGQFLVGPLIANGISWQTFWLGMGGIGIVLAAVLYFLLPAREAPPQKENFVKNAFESMGVVFRNPQTILCGLVSGLLFIPTSILSMTWGVQYLQQARGFEYGDAVLRAATVPAGWIIGCPLLGAISDRLGRRKPVIIAGAVVLLGCVAWALYGGAGLVPPYVTGLVMGIASGASMIPYTVVKEANPREMGGTATGAINFINFSLTALLGPVFAWVLQTISGGGERGLEHYQTTFQPVLYGVALAIALTFLLKETGPAATAPSPMTAPRRATA